MAKILLLIGGKGFLAKFKQKTALKHKVVFL